MAALSLKKAPKLQSFLEEVYCDASLPQDLRDEAHTLLDGADIPWKALKGVSLAVRERWGESRRVRLHEQCSALEPVLAAPAPRVKSPQLLERLAALQKLQEQREYDAMVRDVTQAEQDAMAKSEGGIVNYKAQLSVGLHVMIMMGTFFAAGYTGLSYFSIDPVHHLVGGLCGLIVALLMETVLLVIRTTVPPRLPVEEALMRHSQRQQQPFREGQRDDQGVVPPRGSTIQEKKQQ